MSLVAVTTRTQVTEADVARVISAWTGIPLTKLVESEVDKVGGRIGALMNKGLRRMPLHAPFFPLPPPPWFLQDLNCATHYLCRCCT